MEARYDADIEHCPVAKVQKVIRGKWSMVIIYFLSHETLRFSQLKRKLPQVTEANLTKELRMWSSMVWSTVRSTARCLPGWNIP